MGRELRRVSLDFDWPLHMPWKGFMNPYSPQQCKPCGGSGSSPEYKRLCDDWYGFDRPAARWCDKLTQDEVDALVAGGRLHDLTSEWRGSGEGWVKVRDVTAEEVNAAFATHFMLHDSINSWIACKVRAARLGITEIHCRYCNGEGHHWPEEKYAKLWDEFESIDPPAGDAYQMWETTSEGSPISPPFADAISLAKWLAANRDGSIDEGTSVEQWMKFIEGPGWAPSMIGTSAGGIVSGVQAVV